MAKEKIPMWRGATTGRTSSTESNIVEGPKQATEEEADVADVLVTDAMTKAGERMASDLTNAGIAKSMSGLGGCQDWDEWLGNDIPNKDIVLAYVREEIIAVAAIYIAMHRVSQEEEER